MSSQKPKLGENRGNAGKGRPKGSANKSTKKLKDAILGALDEVGGQAYLVNIAQTDPKTFCGLIGKVLPMTVAGDPDQPLQTITRIELVAAAHDDGET